MILRQLFKYIFILNVFIFNGCGGGGSDDSKNLKLNLKTTEKIAGYEIHIKFTSNTPSGVNLDNSFLGTTGRTVSDLGPNIDNATKEIKFGGFTFGTQNGVTGEFDLLSFKTNDSKSQITITKKSCVDKDANDISCDIEIK